MARGFRAEIVVILNGDDEESERFLRTRHQIRWRRTARVHPGQARNLGISLARGRWLFFLDDDAFIPALWPVRPDWLEWRWASAAAVGGPNLTPPGASSFQSLVGKVLRSRFGAYFSHSRYKKSGRLRECGDESVMLCNLLVRREALERHGLRFDSRLSCNEENLLVQQLLERGERVLYDPELFVFHERRSGPLELARQVFKYGRGRAENSFLNPGSLRWPHWVPALSFAYAVVWLVFLRFRGPMGVAALWSLPFGVYFGFLVFQAGRLRELRALGLYPLVHASYGAGFLIGCGIHGTEAARGWFASPGQVSGEPRRLRLGERLGPG